MPMGRMRASPGKAGSSALGSLPVVVTEASFVDGKRTHEELPVSSAMLPIGTRVEADFTDYLYIGTVINHKNGAMVTRFDSDGAEVELRPNRHSFRQVLADSLKRKSIVGSSSGGGGGGTKKRANVGGASAASAAASHAGATPQSAVKAGQKRPLEVKEKKPATASAASSEASETVDEPAAQTHDINSISRIQLERLLTSAGSAKGTISRNIILKLLAGRPYSSAADAEKRVEGLGKAKIRCLLSHGLRFPGAAPTRPRGRPQKKKKRATAAPKAAASSGGASAATSAPAAPFHQGHLAAPDAKRYAPQLLEPRSACNHFVYPNPAPTIDMKNGLDAAPPEQWESKAAADRAANGTENIGRWIGDLKVSLSLAEDARLSELGAAVVPPSNSSAKGWDLDGMFYGKAGLVPPVRLEEWVNEGKLLPIATEDMDAISNLAVLSSPDFRGALGNGGWKKAVPFIRSFCHCPTAPEPSTDPADKYGIIHLSFRVYVSRLFFELIADESYSELVKALVPCAPFTPCAPAKSRSPKMFTTTVNKRAADNAAYCFTLEGLLKSQEHEGYACAEARPAGMKHDFPGLFPFQRSTVKWMLDAEQGPGINSYFWETRPWADGGAFWFFPLGGELRLLQPPEATGGLLAEEMGLGKTIETLALTLLNPRPKSQLTVQYQRQVQKLCTRATLIIAPKALIGQWCAELHRYANDLSIITYDAGDENVSKVDSSYVRRTAGRDIQSCIVGEKVETTAFAGSSRWLPATVTRVYKRRDSVLYDLRITIGAELLCDHDFVFTSYPTLKIATSNTVLQCLKKISWWRICLDECQMVREATTNLAKSCTDLASVHRWMISGTPLTTAIGDLNGELQFLRVWPFSLSDKDDGFWEHRIGNAWTARDPAALDLLDPLLSTVMIRHSKSQRQLPDHSKLTSLPSNSIQFCGLPLGKGSAAYLYLWIEAFVASEVSRRVESGWGRGAAEQLNPDDKRCFFKLRGLMTMLRRVCTDTKLIELPVLDDAIRKLERRVDEDVGGDAANAAQQGGLRKMTGKLILMWLRQVGRSEQETANVQTDRSYAVETEATKKAREKYFSMTVAELRTLVKTRNLVDRQEENHRVCVDRFRAVSGGDVPQRQRVPRSELPGDGGGCDAGDTVMAPWSDSVVLRPARVTAVHKESCYLEYVQPHFARDTVTKVEGSRLSGDDSREPGSRCLMQTVRYGVTAAFLRLSNTDDGVIAAAGDAMVVGTPILYLEDPDSEPVAGVITGITASTSSRGEKTYDILLQEHVPVTIDKVLDKKGTDNGLLYNVVLDARVVHVGRSGDTIDKPVPIEDLRPRPRNWDPESICAEPKHFVSKDADTGNTGVTPGTSVLFERVIPGVKKVKAKLPELSEPYCHRMLRHSLKGELADGGQLIPADEETLSPGDVIMMRESADVDKKQIIDGEVLFQQGTLEVGHFCKLSRGWKDHFKVVDAVIYALKYPIDSISKQPNKNKPPRYSCLLLNSYRRFKIKQIHENNGASEQASQRTFDVVSAPLLSATVNEVHEKSFDLEFGQKKVDTKLPATRLQLVQRVHHSQVYLCNEVTGGAPVALRPPALDAHVRAAIVSQRGEAAAAAAEAELIADWHPFNALKAGMQVMVAPLPLKKEEQRRKHIDDKKAPTSAYMRFRNKAIRGKIAGVAQDLSDSDIAKQWAKLSNEVKKCYKVEAEAALSKLIEDERLAFAHVATITSSAFDKAGNTVEVRCKVTTQHGTTHTKKFTEGQAIKLSEGSLAMVFSDENGPVPDADEAAVAASAKLAKISKIHRVSVSACYDVEYLPSASIESASAPDVSTDLSLIKSILPGDSVRIQENIPGATHEIGNITPFGLTLRQPWGRDACSGAAIFKMDCSCRKEGFVEELVDADKMLRGEQDRDINESGFIAVNKLMKGDTATIAPCSICMHEPVFGGTVVTQCCHIFCKDCAMDLIKTTETIDTTAKCPVCRKTINERKLVEFVAEEERASEKSTRGPSKIAAASAADANEEDETDEDGGLHTKPNAVQRPAATMSQLEAECFAPEVCFSRLVERNPRLPALDEVFLTHYKAATAVDAPKLARLRQDVSLALQADPSSKFVVFSHHKDALVNAKKMFENGLAAKDNDLSATVASTSRAAASADGASVRCVQIMGGMSKEDRTDAVVQFMTNDAVKMILVSFGQGAAGLTLTAANHVFLLEPCQNAADEAQALTRAHRIGQKRAVRSVIYYTRSTVEERLLAARRANGDFDRDNSDNADNLSILSSTSEVDQADARGIRGSGAAGGGANGEQLGLEGMAQDLGLDSAIFGPRPTAAADAEGGGGGGGGGDDDDDDDDEFEERVEMQDSDDDDDVLLDDEDTGSEDDEDRDSVDDY